MIRTILLTSSLLCLTACGNNTPVSQNKASIEDNIIQAQQNTTAIGARKITATPVTQSAIIAATTGHGEECTQQSPCTLKMALSKLKAGSTLFLRGGEYHLDESIIIPTSGTKSQPIIIEAYPNESVILNGNENKSTIRKGENIVRNGIHIQGKEYVSIRNLEITNMGARGVNILYSSFITIEGCSIHDNYLSGVTIYGGNYSQPYKPYKYGYNIIRDNIIYNNSDAELNQLQKQEGHTYSYEDGDNADGISVSSGKFNKVEHNTVFANADDGIDLWRSNNSYAAYNLVFDNGRGSGGNGNGIKAGGNRYFDHEEDSPNGKLAIVEYNIAFKNKRIGFDINSGKKVTFRYNTSWKNGAQGFTTYDNTIVNNNIAWENSKKTETRKQHTNNSWQSNATIEFVSTDKNSADFLRPSKNINMGAYAHMKPIENKNKILSKTTANAKIFLIGDSTVHNMTKGEMGWGSALATYVKNPDNLFNQARSGASSSTYKTPHPRHHDWESTKKLIQQSDVSKGGYLFIQFGHNNKDNNYALFYNDLRTYVKEAKTLGLIPVLITPVARLYKYDRSHKDYPQIVRDLAKDEDILLLDLYDKSWNKFNTYATHKVLADKFAYDDHTHFNPQGAKIVAGWVKELACEASPALCVEFK